MIGLSIALRKGMDNICELMKSLRYVSYDAKNGAFWFACVEWGKIGELPYGNRWRLALGVLSYPSYKCGYGYRGV